MDVSEIEKQAREVAARWSQLATATARYEVLRKETEALRSTIFKLAETLGVSTESTIGNTTQAESVVAEEPEIEILEDEEEPSVPQKHILIGGYVDRRDDEYQAVLKAIAGFNGLSPTMVQIKEKVPHLTPIRVTKIIHRLIKMGLLNRTADNRYTIRLVPRETLPKRAVRLADFMESTLKTVPGSCEDEIINLLQKHGGSLKATELQKALRYESGFRYSMINGALVRLKAANRLVVVGRTLNAVYYLT